MNIKVDFDNIVVKEDKNDFNVKVLMLKGEKGDAGDGENNVIEEVQVNGTALPVTNKAVNVNVPIVDSAISSSSTNPVQNKAIYNALEGKVNNSELNNYYQTSEIDDLMNNVANTYETIQNHNTDITRLTNQISSLENGNPIPVSSISEMTDTTKTYVNTTDGHWYYYDGTEWADGGIYQAVVISPDDPEIVSINNKLDYGIDEHNILLKNYRYGNKNNLTLNLSTGGLTDNNGVIAISSSSSYYNTMINCNGNRVYRINTKTSTSNTYPYYAYSVDLDGKINGSYLHKRNKASYLNEVIILPKYTDKLYIMTSSAIGELTVEEYINIPYDNYITPINLLDYSSLNKYAYYDSSTDTFKVSSSSFATEFIPCNANDVLYFNTNVANKYISYFDSDFNYISRTLVSVDNDITVPTSTTVPNNSSIKYFNINYSTSENEQMITKYMTPQSYIPFNEKILTNFADKKFMYLGDSISFKELRWITTFNANLMITNYENYAVSGAHIKDYSDTTYPYNGNPSSIDQHNNVLGNQVQKAINNHTIIPDYIFIFAGTNDNMANEPEEIESTFSNEGNVIALNSVDRKTFAGALRWSYEKLTEEFPNSRIIIITPIQCAVNVREFNIQKQKAVRIKEISDRLACITFDAFNESGIYSNLESSNTVGRYLVDGLHPYPATGGKQLGNYLTNKMKYFT